MISRINDNHVLFLALRALERKDYLIGWKS